MASICYIVPQARRTKLAVASATEVLLTDAEPESAIAVGFAGSPISGVMIPGKNRVCVTFEVLLLLSPT